MISRTMLAAPMLILILMDCGDFVPGATCGSPARKSIQRLLAGVQAKVGLDPLRLRHLNGPMLTPLWTALEGAAL